MAFAHAPLDAALLGPAVGKFVGAESPQKIRKMAAAGLAPLAPRDMLLALYQLWVLNGEESEQAGKTVEGLPAAVLDGALADKRLPAGVLDLIGRKFARNEKVLAQVVRHVNVDDESLIGISRVCPESICDMLADNETRWLGCPAIVGGLYQNRNCRMSVVHRMIELAEREGVDLPLPAMDEIRTALAQSGPVDESRDEMFKQVHSTGQAVEAETAMIDVLENADVDDELELPDLPDNSEIYVGPLPGEEVEPETESESESETESGTDSEVEPDETAVGAPVIREEHKQPISRENRMQQILQMRPLEKIRTALLGDKYDRSLLVRDSNRSVALAAIRSPKVRDDEAIAYAANRALSLEVITYISNRREWIKLYSVKLNLVMNPKTPMARSMSLLGFLNRGDVQKVARSKNIPSALATAAKRKLASRE
jgi:hypothetical protein